MNVCELGKACPPLCRRPPIIAAILLSSIAGRPGWLHGGAHAGIGLRMTFGARVSQIVHALLVPVDRPLAIAFFAEPRGGSAVVKTLKSGISRIAGLRFAAPFR